MTRDNATLRLALRQPFDREGALSYLRRTNIPGFAWVEGEHYLRTVPLEKNRAGIIAARPEADRLLLTLPTAPEVEGALVARVRRLFDLDADPGAVRRHLQHDSLLAPLLRRYPGVRLLGSWDPFESAVRTVIGQQVSVAAAATFTRRLVQLYGPEPLLPDGARGRLFPGPEILSDLGDDVRLTRSRTDTVRTLAREVVSGRLDLAGDPAEVARSLIELPGIGEWTTEYLRLQLGDGDAFPAGDLVLRKMAGAGVVLSERELRERAEPWRPWRAYGAVLLWRAYLDGVG